jgi:hypothetical protein
MTSVRVVTVQNFSNVGGRRSSEDHNGDDAEPVSREVGKQRHIKDDQTCDKHGDANQPVDPRYLHRRLTISFGSFIAVPRNVRNGSKADISQTSGTGGKRN